MFFFFLSIKQSQYKTQQNYKSEQTKRHWVSILSLIHIMKWINLNPLSLQASVSAGGPSKESSDATKDEGVFKAPPPPPKVTKCVTFPTDPYQDNVTTLKCRKEHKEVREYLSLILKLYATSYYLLLPC